MHGDSTTLKLRMSRSDLKLHTVTITRSEKGWVVATDNQSTEVPTMEEAFKFVRSLYNPRAPSFVRAYAWVAGIFLLLAIVVLSL